MRIALAQINSNLADFEFNKNKIIENIHRLAEKKSELIIFPEASLFGYHPFDLLERSNLVDQQTRALKEILKTIPVGVHVLIGGFEKNKNKKGRPYFNTAFLCQKNKIVKTFHKELLPTGDVFDEARFIEKGSLKNNYFKIKNKKFFLTICEDIWAWEQKNKKSDYTENPLKKIKREKIDLIINMSASPFDLSKLKKREFVVSETAKYFKAPMVYTNLVGAQDELIYDGQSFLVDAKGKKQFQMLSFEEDSNVFDLNTLESWNTKSKPESAIEQLHKALVLGLRDYAKKTNQHKVHLGLSGGIDSAVVAALAADAFGPQNVSLFALPTQFNLSESFTTAKQMAANIGCRIKEISIQSTFEHIKNIFDAEFSVVEFGLVHENMQSRIRGLYLMAYSNLTASLLLTTGNKSEYATGYSTLYGDMCGGLAPIGDLTKKQVYDLAKFYNQNTEIIPQFIIERPPSAELRPNQKDQDSLPVYDDLDKSVENIVQKKLTVKSETEKWLYSKLMKTEFKRWQAPPILKISEHSFGRGRRYPIAHAAKE
jgi:NAD+ synthase (glutamine-hydrolysing)